MCDLRLVHVGPCSVDLAFMLADFILYYHYHMLTPENNDWHRRVAYKLLEAAKLFGIYIHLFIQPFSAAVLSTAFLFGKSAAQNGCLLKTSLA